MSLSLHSLHFLGVLQIRIHIFLDIPDPDPLVGGVDPDRDPSIILLSSSKNSMKNLDSYCFVSRLFIQSVIYLPRFMIMMFVDNI
jgi:hypothetical protein